MAEFLAIMGLPLIGCWLLTGIHVVLGLHVIARRVIFVDLAIAQVAALGAVVGLVLGLDAHADATAVKACSLSMALLGALVVSFLRTSSEPAPREALIGVVYVVALAATVLASIRLPHGSDELHHLLAGSLLWVDGHTILGAAVTYALVAAVLLIFRRPMACLSFADGKGMTRRAAWGWDLLFYSCFAVVVTSSVSIGGVLVVFSYLVIPGVIATLFTARPGTRLAIAWGVGTAVSAGAMAISYLLDLPEGPVVVLCLGGVLVVAWPLSLLRSEAGV